MQYGLIGEHLSHSYSREIHEQIAGYSYELKELEPSQLPDFLKAKDFRAINVTIPYKQDVIPFLDEIDEQARRIGAVNTIVNRNGKLFGYNTDFSGMRALIEKLGLELKNKKILILGTGGTSKTAHAVAESLGAGEILHVSRNPNAFSEEDERIITYKEAESFHRNAQIIINTTPCGMFPKTEGTPICLEVFPELEGVIDAVYNPLRTNLILDAQESGLAAEGGLYMLAAQAVFACGHFLDREVSEISSEEIDRAFQNVRNQKRNIVLCGMPSCGKTTVSSLLGRKRGAKVIDTDEEFVKRTGMEIAEFSKKNGEEAFRDIESEIVKEVSLKSGVIIATGGDAVLRKENVRALKQNGILVFIDRPLSLLTATLDRPFSATPEALKQRFDERYEIYCGVCDLRVDGALKPEKVAESVIEKLQ